MKNIFTIKTVFRSMGLLSTILLSAGCSHNPDWIEVEHPGSYELIKMGYKDLDGNRVRVTKAHEKTFLSYLEIPGPSYFSLYLLENTEINKGESVLDIGTGSGIQAVYAAEKASHILATDIVERSLRNVIVNARLHGVEDKVTVRKSDLFNNINSDEQFDVIITSIPYAHDEKTQENWKLHERFFNDVAEHLNPDGRIYFVTGSLKNLPRTQELIEKNNLKTIKLNMAYAKKDNLELIVYTIKHAPVTPTQDDVKN
jgi:release factor glutamine methyltransferase